MSAITPFVPGRVTTEDDETRRDRELREQIKSGEVHLTQAWCPLPHKTVYCDCDKTRWH
jgi:hypothetical protein